MAKSFEDYMNDPEIKDEMMGLRITHAMRLKVQDEIAGMTDAEQLAYINEKGKATLERLGMSHLLVTEIKN